MNHNYYYYGDKIDQEHEVVILRDLPNDLDSLKDSLKNLNYSQLYLVLQHRPRVYILMVCPRQINLKSQASKR